MRGAGSSFLRLSLAQHTHAKQGSVEKGDEKREERRCRADDQQSQGKPPMTAGVAFWREEERMLSLACSEEKGFALVSKRRQVICCVGSFYSRGSG